MSEENKKKDEELKLKEPTDVSVEVGFVNESQVQNVSGITDLQTQANAKTMKLSFPIGDDKVAETEIKFDFNYKDEAAYIKMFSLENMRERLSKGETLSDIYADLKNFIMDNKDSNPDKVQRALSQILSDYEKHYDHCMYSYGLNVLIREEGYHREHLGNNGEEILGKVLATPEDEELHGMVCSTISEFGMRLLDECGIKAAMLSGGTKSTNHTTLLWQRSDGKYVLSNYDDSYTLDASNIKDAAKEVYKRNLGLINNGYIYLIDNNGSYHEYAMKDEAVWGNELDKRDYNSQTIFDHSVASQPSIQGNVQVSNLGSVSAEVKGTLAYGNDSKSKETSFSLGYKKSNMTSLADSSVSVGGKLEHLSETKTSNGVKFSGTKIIANITKLHTDDAVAGRSYFQPLSSKSFADESQLVQLKELYGNEYEGNNPIDKLNWEYDWCNRYINEFYDLGSNGDAPISKEEFINDFLNDYKGEKGELYNDLDDFNKHNVNLLAEQTYESYLINNRYNGAVEIVKDKADFYKDLIDNYDKYKDEYVNRSLETYKQLQEPTDKDSKTTDIKGFDTTNVSLFLRKTFGKQKTLLKDGNLELSKGYQLSGTVGLTDIISYSDSKQSNKGVFTSFGADARLAAEEGLKLDVNGRNSLSSSSISGGVVADFALKSGTLTPTVSPGVKLNGSTIFRTKLNPNLSLGVNASGYTVITKPSVDYGADVGAQAAYKTNKKDVTIFGGVNYGIEKQRVRINNFNEETENLSNLGVSVGAQLGNKTKVSLNYNGLNNKLNSSKSRELYSVMAKVNL